MAQDNGHLMDENIFILVVLSDGLDIGRIKVADPYRGGNKKFPTALIFKLFFNHEVRKRDCAKGNYLEREYLR